MNGKTIRLITTTMRSDDWHYQLGGKVDNLKSFPPHNATKGIDCSGFHRYCVYQASSHPAHEILPDGSVNEHDRYAELAKDFNSGVHWVGGRMMYEVVCRRFDNTIYACVSAPSQNADGIGHIWFVSNGYTYESHGGLGPDTRPAFIPRLANIVSDIYDVTNL